MRSLLSGRSPATYAGQRYRDGVRSWRRAIRWKLLLVFGPFIAASVIWGLLEHHGAAYLAGWLGGGAAGALLALGDSPPAYLQTWGDGDAGERRTHRVLVQLGWELIEDVDNGRGNYDHILVGPPGVFLLDSKNWTGITSIVDGAPKLARRHDPQAGPDMARTRNAVLAASAELSRTIRARTGRGVWVSAVVVFWNEFPDGLVESDRLTYVHGSRLLEFLESRPVQLAPVVVAAVSDALADLKLEAARKHAERLRLVSE
jgi:nuclease-like protein